MVSEAQQKTHWHPPYENQHLTPTTINPVPCDDNGGPRFNGEEEANDSWMGTRQEMG